MNVKITKCITTGISLEKFTALRKHQSHFSERCLRQRIMSNKINVMLIQEFFWHHPWSIRNDFVNPPGYDEKYMRYSIAFINYDSTAWERWILAMTKWLISLILSHYSSSFVFVRQLIIAASDKKICVWKPADLKAVTQSPCITIVLDFLQGNFNSA